jgi:Flp pilus assembly protein TadG
MKRSERGSSLVETALIAPVLLIILFGIADAGRAFSSYITMTNAVREGARYAARRPLETENIQAKTLVEIGNADGSLKCDSPPKIDTEADGSGTAKRVTLTCTFGTITPLIGAFPMTATAAMKVEGPQ